MLQVPITSARMSQVQVPPAQISQVPKLYPSMSQASFFPNPVSSTTDMQNIFAGVGAPTVDLWTLYQPVVLLRTVRKYNRKKPYSCGKCGQCFLTKTNLISHHSSHVTDKVSGCVGCGLLLSSKKVVPRFHVCNSPNTTTKFRLVTARPPSYKRVNVAVTDTSLSAQGPQATSSLLLKSQNLSAVSKDRQTPHVTSTLPLTNENIRTYSKSNHRLHATQSLQSESPKPNASKSINVSLPSKSQNPSASSKSNQRLPDTPSLQLNTPTNCASSSRPDWFTCRVCHLPFETAQLLQRHKCIKAKEFMAQHGLGRQQYKLKRVTQVASPISAHMNGVRKVGIPAPGNIRKSQVMAISLDKGQGAVPMNRKAETDRDDDCYIVEGGPDKPAEMIYQVTSSVPIKT
uniref:oocyte zinc finger protein XlCOF7.1-like n=1 Tax=Monopterus albus TaxID=43700 RepID=UPI0009B4D4C0|nr:oocyte zinc finger protein XlCOF7.1-like [Monopterus albus]